MRKIAWLTTISLLVLAAAFAQSGYHQIKKISIPGDGFWDYLTTDPGTGRVFVSHGTEVDVVDAAKGEVVGKIAGLKLVHGIALVTEFNRGFISDGAANQVVIFDMKTLEKTGAVAAGTNPDGIIYDPASKRVFAFNGRSANATAVDAEKGTLAGTVMLEGKPEFPAPDGKGHVFVNIEDKSEVMDIDAKALTVSHKWPLAPCEEPSGMAMDTKTRRIYSGCDNKMMAVMDADSGKVVTTVPIGAGVDATWFDPGTKTVFNSCGQDGVLTVIHEDSPDKYTVVENAPTEKGARTMAVDTKTHKVYLSVAQVEFQPPAEGDGKGRPRRRVIPGSFGLLEFGR
ncbi:MAG TPA: YncE family protein [Bryobacteraceae bacterium]|nr:YncE family protein [Bryobacteraceae bacterium]